MGAVFGLFAGFYYWINLMVGKNYIEDLGKLHFWITFLGVNITFFPMHFLGLAGMPRRIPDYPDSFYDWNFIASFGSILTTIGIFVFFLLIICLFWKKNKKEIRNFLFYYIDSFYFKGQVFLISSYLKNSLNISNNSQITSYFLNFSWLRKYEKNIYKFLK
jgi:heme/copper-type cytochrome/quinol oxidase subunit 1